MTFNLKYNHGDPVLVVDRLRQHRGAGNNRRAGTNPGRGRFTMCSLPVSTPWLSG